MHSWCASALMYLHLGKFRHKTEIWMMTLFILQTRGAMLNTNSFPGIAVSFHNNPILALLESINNSRYFAENMKICFSNLNQC